MENIGHLETDDIEFLVKTKGITSFLIEPMRVSVIGNVC